MISHISFLILTFLCLVFRMAFFYPSVSFSRKTYSERFFFIPHFANKNSQFFFARNTSGLPWRSFRKITGHSWAPYLGAFKVALTILTVRKRLALRPLLNAFTFYQCSAQNNDQFFSIIYRCPKTNINKLQKTAGSSLF